MDTDMVMASPHRAGGAMIDVPPVRKWISFFGNRVFSLAFPGNITTVTGMTRAYRREVLDALDLESDGKEVHVEIVYKALDYGFRVSEVPAILRWKVKDARPVRRSHFKWGMILSHLLLSLMLRPFILFGTLGFSLLGIGSGCGLYLFVLSASGEHVGSRPLLLFSVLMILIGLQIILFGFVAIQNRDLKRQIVRLQTRMKLQESRDHSDGGSRRGAEGCSESSPPPMRSWQSCFCS